MKNAFYTILHALFFLPVMLLFRIRVRGRKNEPRRKQGPYLVCANHQSVLDPVFICAATHRQQPHFMAKEELFRVPFLGWLVRCLGAYPVARGKRDVGAIRHTVDMLKSHRSVGIFPQGTRCPGQNPADCRIKAGAGMIAAHAEATVLPVFIGMKDQRWKFFRRVTVIIGEPIAFSELGYRHGEPGEYARITQQIYEKICALGEASK